MLTPKPGAQVWTNIAVIGPAQHGKSTLAGYLLWSQGEVHDRTMREAQRAARERGDLKRQFSYLLDRRPHERATTMQLGRSQTQEPSWWGFNSREGLRYLLMDSPGQLGRVGHVIGVLSEADAALLVVDVHDYVTAGSQPATWRGKDSRLFTSIRGQIDAYLAVARFYEIEQLVVAVHKMDRFQFAPAGYEEVCEAMRARLAALDWDPASVWFVPTAVDAAASQGFNIDKPAELMSSWYKGPTLLDTLKRTRPRPAPMDADFRMDVNYVYQGHRIHVPGAELVVTGKVLSGKVQKDDHVVFQPSGIECRVRSIEPIDNSKVVERVGRWLPRGEQSQAQALAGELVGLGCKITRFGDRSEVMTGELLGSARRPPGVGKRLRAEVVFLYGMPYTLFINRLSGVFGIGYFSTGFRVEKVSRDGGQTWHDVAALGADNPATEPDVIQAGSTVWLELLLSKPAPLEKHVPGTELGRFVLLDTGLLLFCGGCVLGVLE